jgi:hypothetical protein
MTRIFLMANVNLIQIKVLFLWLLFFRCHQRRPSRTVPYVYTYSW